MISSSDRSLSLLRAARDSQLAQRRAEAATFVAVAEWADGHTTAALVDDPFGALGLLRDDLPTDAWDGVAGGDRFLELGGPGCPLVSEFAVIELAAALCVSSDAGRRLVGDAVEARHRLPRLYESAAAGRLPVWKARKIAALTRTLTPEGADHVDRHLSPIAHRIGMPTVERLVAETAARHDPEAAEGERLDAAASTYVQLDLRQPDPVTGHVAGTVAVSGLLDLADAVDLDGALTRLAADLAAAGSPQDLDARRATALGELARRQTSLDLGGATAGTSSRTAARQVVLHVHLSHEALVRGSAADPARPVAGGLDLARVEATGLPRTFVTADQVREWCADPDTAITLVPVVDLAAAVAVDAYEIPDRIARQVRLAHPTCVFPFCTRPARVSDLDHRESWVDDGTPGQTSTGNLAPLCRRHHRAKTHRTIGHPPGAPPGRDSADRTGASRRAGRWHYRPTEPARGEPPHGFRWTSPHGLTYTVDPFGTVAH